jgi:transposase
MSFQGIEFTPEMRQLVVNVKQFFDQNKQNPQALQDCATALTASALGISESTVKIIMAAFNKKGVDGLTWSHVNNRGRPSFIIEQGIESVIRQFVREANKSGKQITIDVIAKHLSSARPDCKIAAATLWRALVRWGFEFGTGTRSAQLKESDRIIIQRRQYLRQKIANRKEKGGIKRPEIYLDESYINKNHSRDDTWYLSEDGGIIGKPTGKGERLIIVNAISEDGWIPDAKLVFKASSKTADYHLSMNWEAFKDWFVNKLLKNIPANSLIIMDNASYHNVLTEETFPKPSHSMRRLQEWLEHNDIPWRDDMLKAELYELCSRLAPKPEFSIDRIAMEKGHTILRTPPYHPELQPIETCWAVVKAHVASNNDFTMAKVSKLLEEGFDKVTTRTIKGILKKVRQKEDNFWEEDSNRFTEKDVLKNANSGAKPKKKNKF